MFKSLPDMFMFRRPDLLTSPASLRAQEQARETAEKRSQAANEPRRSSMVNVTFCASAPLHATGDVAMHVMGSLPSLGSWDTLRARKMVAKGSKWYLSLPVPEDAEFLYQVVLLSKPSRPGDEPRNLWQGPLEKRARGETVLGETVANVSCDADTVETVDGDAPWAPEALAAMSVGDGDAPARLGLPALFDAAAEEGFAQAPALLEAEPTLPARVLD
ncbi:hypothetical protein T484DRAFT_1785109, partial [Baffinella frigidus]